jgi:hypothetical protein
MVLKKVVPPAGITATKTVKRDVLRGYLESILHLEKDMEIEITVMLVPLVMGIVQALAKHDGIDAITENFVAWLGSKNRKVSSGNSIFARTGRFSVYLLYSLFRTIHDLTVGIGDYGVRSGIRLAAYLYLLVFLFILLITFGYKIILLAVAGLGLFLGLMMLMRVLSAHKSLRSGDPSGGFVENIWPFFRSDSTRSKVAGLFEVSRIDVDYTGDILAPGSGQSPGKKRIGRVDKNGLIYDTRKQAAEQIGRIDADGRVVGDRLIN